MNRVAIIDDSSANFSAQHENGIPIRKFTAFQPDGSLFPTHEYDDELLRLIPFLDRMKDVKDTSAFINSRVMF
jgi:TFIIF-interacting CTD phosphatase-like protein